MSLFMAILEWSLPTGWNEADVGQYDVNPVVKSYCKDMNHLSLPTFRQMQNQTKAARRVLMTIPAISVGCVFTPEIRIISRCGVYGPWTGFKVDLNCSLITGYKCKPKPFDPPGNAENVTLAVSPAKPPSPFAVDLHIRWEPPKDLGSKGVIDKYVIRSGKAEQLIPPLPASFTEKPMERNVSQDIRELIFQLRTEPSPFAYGVQVIPYAPDQFMSENDMGILPVKMIHVGHNDSMAVFRKQGTVLYDNNGTVIVYMNKTMPVHFMFDTSMGRSQNSTKYVVQWGPLVGHNHLNVENRTVIPLNQSDLIVRLKSSVKEYGLKIKYLSQEEEEPADTDWDTVPVVTFKLPDYEEDGVKAERIQQDYFNLVPIYVLVPVISLLILIIVFLRLGVRRQRFKNLEQRLAEIEDEVDEHGEIDHYYIVRTQEDSPGDLTPTVVSDAWELPHTCLKIGRTLGSGAFGQVVRGRVSRSLMAQRGIDLHGTASKTGLFVTVAVKMLQEYTEERYREDFLKEIQMMKDIGYHRNLVSMLGCCTLREPYCLIVEYVPYGDLLTYLRKIRQKIQEQEDEIGNYVNQEVELFSPLDLLSVARQITLGMEYLSQKGYVHRDLAARNVLVGKNKTVKIGDFGLARYIYHDVGKVYVNRRGGKLPLKWMSVEAIFDLTFSTASDVWAFGVVLFEIVTLGGSPYPLISNQDLLHELRDGYRMEQPENCSEEIYEIMLWCWKTKPCDRPTFTQLQETFTTMLQRDSGQDYFTFDINEQHDYYRINPEEMNQDDGIIETTVNTENEIAGENISSDAKTTDESNTELAPERTDQNFASASNHFPVVQVDSGLDHNCYEDPEGHQPSKTIDIPNNTNSIEQDTVSNSSVGSTTFAGTRRAVADLDRLSGSSDEVFTECPGCLRLSGCAESIRVCPDCQKTRIALSMFDLHSPDRTDSAISSATSDELKSDDGNSPNSSVSSAHQDNCDSELYQEHDTNNKTIVKNRFSTSYYDEASIAAMIKQYPTWTEGDSQLLKDSRMYKNVAAIKPVSVEDGEPLKHANHDELEPTPYCFSRYRLFSDPYYNFQLNINNRERWSMEETRM